MKKLFVIFVLFICSGFFSSCELSHFCHDDEMKKISPSFSGGGDDQDEFIIQLLYASTQIGISGGTVSLYSISDNALLATKVTDENGKAVFSVEYGSYLVKAWISNVLVHASEATYSSENQCYVIPQ